MSLIIAVNGHTIWHQRVERYDLTFSITDYLGVGIAPQEQMRHQCLTEHEGGHLWIRLIVQESVERMLQGLLLTAGIHILIQMHRKASDGFGQDSDAGIYGGHLHGGALVHVLAGIAAAEQEAIAAAVGTVGRLVPRTEQTRNETHKITVLSL